MPLTRFDKLSPAKRERILEVAAQEFARYGYEDASINRMLEQAQMSKGAAYYYFEQRAFAAHRPASGYRGTHTGDLLADSCGTASSPVVAFVRAALVICRSACGGSTLACRPATGTTRHVVQATQNLGDGVREARAGNRCDPQRPVRRPDFCVVSGSG